MKKEALILVVDDNPDTLELTALRLRMEGFEVIEARNGGKALKLLNERRPDLILTDIMMPEVDGLELIRRLRATPELSDIPIVIITAAKMRQQAVTSAAVASLTKPLDLMALVREVKRALPSLAAA